MSLCTTRSLARERARALTPAFARLNSSYLHIGIYIALTPDVQKGARSSPFVFNIFLALMSIDRTHARAYENVYAFVYNSPTESIKERQLRINRNLFRSYTNILGFFFVCVPRSFFFSLFSCVHIAIIISIANV